MPETPQTREMQFVVKVSKFCNLRCTYCYEFAELGNRETMTREQVRRMYEHLGSYLDRRDAEDGARTEIQLFWHGGEPLLVDPCFYWDTFADQRELLGPDRPVLNAVQTNLVRLDDERLRLLLEGFDQIGVSIDLFGGLRVNAGGRDPQQAVISNLQRLLAAGGRAGCITVLTARNLAKLPRIFRFYDQAGIPFRVLPLFDAVTEEQTAAFTITLDEQLQALCDLTDLWLSGENLTSPPSPLDSYVPIAARYLAGGPRDRYYSRREWPLVNVVNTNGDCFTYGEPYGDPDWCIGNVFESPLDDLYASAAFQRCVDEADRRQALNCTTCPYFGYCDGSLIAETEQNVRDQVNGVLRCTARPVVDHLVSRLRGVPELANVPRDLSTSAPA
jgi:uncharacterized protein